MEQRRTSAVAFTGEAKAASTLATIVAFSGTGRQCGRGLTLAKTYVMRSLLSFRGLVKMFKLQKSVHMKTISEQDKNYTIH